MSSDQIPDTYEFLQALEADSSWEELQSNIATIEESIEKAPIPTSRKIYLRQLLTNVLNRFIGLLTLAVTSEDVRLYKSLADFTEIQFQAVLSVAKRVHDAQ